MAWKVVFQDENYGMDEHTVVLNNIKPDMQSRI